MKSLFSLVFSYFVLTLTVFAQKQINNSMPFQDVDSKDYSIVVPSSYIESESIPAFLALHPLNISRWNAETWCAELTEFAESNGVILICPDGGIDGKIDDPIDTAFTSFLLDSAFLWYNIDPENLYATGFSWGGKTTYTYGLNHINRFAGLMPIGAAISISDVNNIAQYIIGKPIYIIHGALDSPGNRFWPLLESMEENTICAESNLLPGVGHTIDFNNQLEILTTGYNYLKDIQCLTSIPDISKIKTEILPYNILQSGQSIVLNPSNESSWKIYSRNGILIKTGNTSKIDVPVLPGIYIVRSGKQSQLFVVI